MSLKPAVALYIQKSTLDPNMELDFIVEIQIPRHYATSGGIMVNRSNFQKSYQSDFANRFTQSVPWKQLNIKIEKWTNVQFQKSAGLVRKITTKNPKNNHQEHCTLTEKSTKVLVLTFANIWFAYICSKEVDFTGGVAPLWDISRDNENKTVLVLIQHSLIEFLVLGSSDWCILGLLSCHHHSSGGWNRRCRFDDGNSFNTDQHFNSYKWF